jgi:hypothetical protein
MKRKHFRVKPDFDDFCLVDTVLEGEFSPSIGAFIVNESPMGGCGLVVRKGLGLEIGLCVRLKLGKLMLLQGRIVWLKSLDEELDKLGIEFLS